MGSNPILAASDQAKRGARAPVFDHDRQDRPRELDVHVICDNYATHRPRDPGVAGPPSTGAPALHPDRVVVDQPGRAVVRVADRPDDPAWVHKSVQALEHDIGAWVADWNQHPRPFIWTKTAEETLESLARYRQRISGAGHQGVHRLSALVVGHDALELPDDEPFGPAVERPARRQGLQASRRARAGWGPTS
jgi:hypothetical protein